MELPLLEAVGVAERAVAMCDEPTVLGKYVADADDLIELVKVSV